MSLGLPPKPNNKVEMQNPKNQNVKFLPIGFNYCFFLFNFLWFFVRGNLKLGIFWLVGVLILPFVAYPIFIDIDYADVEASSDAAAKVIGAFFGIVGTFSSIFLFYTGNKAVGRSLIKKGWVFVKPDSESAVLARQKWKTDAIEKVDLKNTISRPDDNYSKDIDPIEDNKYDPFPISEEPQTSQKSQEPEPKKEKSIEDKIKQLNDLKEKNLINDEEYNMKKEKLLEEL
jgi:hypothetical protein